MQAENKLTLSYVDNIENSKDNEFENFLWKRAKSVKLEKTKENSNFISDIKKKLTPSKTLSTISEEIEEYMVDYLKTMEFSKTHSNEISNFFKENLKNMVNDKNLVLELEKIEI